MVYKRLWLCKRVRVGESVPPFFIRQCLNVWKKLSLGKKEQFASYMQVVMSYYDRDWERETNPHLENKTIRRTSTIQYLNLRVQISFFLNIKSFKSELCVIHMYMLWKIMVNKYIYISVLSWSVKFYLITSEYTDMIKVICFYRP